MPSLHVGWALLIAVVLIASCRTRWRWLWLLHPVATSSSWSARPTTTGSTASPVRRS